jgi:hypothetical protein
MLLNTLKYQHKSWKLSFFIMDGWKKPRFQIGRVGNQHAKFSQIRVIKNTGCLWPWKESKGLIVIIWHPPIALAAKDFFPFWLLSRPIWLLIWRQTSELGVGPYVKQLVGLPSWLRESPSRPRGPTSRLPSIPRGSQANPGSAKPT